MLTTLGDEVLGQQRRTGRVTLDGDDFVLPAGHELRTLPTPDAWNGLALEALPPEALDGLVVVLAMKPGAHGYEPIAARPELVLQDGWRVVVLGAAEAVQRLRRLAADATEAG